MLPQLSFRVLFPNEPSLDPLYLDKSHGVLANQNPYFITDLYCQDLWCECHKVHLVIQNSQGTVMATVSYGWKSKRHYYEWGLDRDLATSLTDGFLDAWSEQSVHGEVFLEAIQHKLKGEKEFMNAIKKRYRLFKEVVNSLFYTPVVAPPRSLPDNVVSLDNHRRQKTS